MGTADKEFFDLLKAGAACIIHDGAFWHGRVISARRRAGLLVVEAKASIGEIKLLQGLVLFSSAPPGRGFESHPLGDRYAVYPDTPSVRALIELYLRAKDASYGSSDPPWGWGSG